MGVDVFSLEHPCLNFALKPGFIYCQYAHLSLIIYAKSCKLIIRSCEDAAHLLEFNAKCLRRKISLHTSQGTT